MQAEAEAESVTFVLQMETGMFESQLWMKSLEEAVTAPLPNAQSAIGWVFGDDYYKELGNDLKLINQNIG